MAKVKQVETLQVTENMPYQHRFWKIERIGWIVFLGLLLLVGLGVAGGVGPFNQATAANEQVEVQYERYARRAAPTIIEVKLKSVEDSTAQLLIKRDFINEYQVTKITPEPSAVKVGNDVLVYEFNIPEGAKNANVTFSLEPDTKTLGSVSGRIGRTSEGLITLSQFVYP